MFLEIIKSIFSNRKKNNDKSAEDYARLRNAVDIWTSGDIRNAALAFKDYVDEHPYSAEALNNFGICLAAMGNKDEAAQKFELAYSLDDTFLPAIVNHARLLIERKKSALGLQFLQEAWCCDPGYAALYNIYASMNLSQGNAERGSFFQSKGWMFEFNSLRLANGFLFTSAYFESNEARLAAEHRFWAETLRPLKLQERLAITSPRREVAQKQKAKRIKIGYWSPDCRDHSVRFFFRPLLENHDKEQFEVFVYDDDRVSDRQTEAIKNAAEHFFDVYELTDLKLYELMLSHDLDILVELAGHTSSNRLPMFQERLARLHITGLGYPPTTGLSSIDAKIIDRYVHTDDAHRYYTEEPMVLPNSFWCFDPMEEVSLPCPPPVLNNGYITFASIGNLAKVSDQMILCWAEILKAVDNSRFLIRSISFEDPEVFEMLQTRLQKGGVPMDRVDLKMPEIGVAFFNSFSEIDVILDTYPFNGGTTTCFATYMGVPVVSLVGNSLTSRMGLSILSNLGVPELAVLTAEEYIEKAIWLAGDIEYLEVFRKQVRDRFKATSLGNGEMYAKDFENACRMQLISKDKNPPYQTKVDAIPVEHAVARAYAVFGYGQKEEADRILAYCFANYPESALPHLCKAYRIYAENGSNKAIEYIVPILGIFPNSEKISALIEIVKWALKAGDEVQAKIYFDQLKDLIPNNQLDALQIKLYEAAFSQVAINPQQRQFQKESISILVPCDDLKIFEKFKNDILKRYQISSEYALSIERVDFEERGIFFNEKLKKDEFSIIVILHPNVLIAGVDFFQKISDCLNGFDVVGVFGSQRWGLANWQLEDTSQKALGAIIMSSAQSTEIQVLGPTDTTAVVGGMAVLYGGLIAMRPSRLPYIEFDEELACADFLMEEDWVTSLGGAGAAIAVHRNLGVVMNSMPVVDQKKRVPGCMHLLKKRSFDPFSMEKGNGMTATLPVKNIDEGLDVMNRLYGMSVEV